MKFRYVFLFTALLLILCSAFSCGCCKDKNCPDSLFYQVPYSLTPLKDTFNLGDTIWLEMDFGEELTDLNGGIKNTFSNYDFRIELQCGQIDVDPPTARTTDALQFIREIGRDSIVELSISGISVYRIFPLYNNGQYRFKCGLITLQKGLFSFGVTPIQFNAFEEEFTIKGNCDCTLLEIGSKLTGGEGNYRLCTLGLNPVFQSLSEETFIRGGGYCFYVK